MRTWFQKLEKMAAAVAFAEEGEWKMASSLLQEPERRPVARETQNKNQPKVRTTRRSYQA